MSCRHFNMRNGMRSCLTTLVVLAGVALVNCPTQSVAQSSQNKPAFDYEKHVDSLYIMGWTENSYSVSCGWANKADFGGPGYISLYEHAYWLLGTPHQSWNFDIQTAYPNGTNVFVELLLDGKFLMKYPETITISGGVASSSSDICEDGLPGLCPDRQSAESMRDLIPKLDKARSLTFRILDGDKVEQHEIIVSDFEHVHDAINACLGTLLTQAPRE